MAIHIARWMQLCVASSMLMSVVHASRSHDFDLASDVAAVHASRAHEFDLESDLAPSDDPECSEAVVGCKRCGMKGGRRAAATWDEGIGLHKGKWENRKKLTGQWADDSDAPSSKSSQSTAPKGVVECWTCDYNAGYKKIPVKGKCELCSPGCAKCSKEGQCIKCKSQDTYLWPNGTCAPCAEKKSSGYVRKDGKCLECAEMCYSCEKAGPGKCDKDMCIAWWGITEDQKCGECAPNCDDCTYAGTCENSYACKEGHGFNSQKQCMPCAEHCRECPEAGAGKCDRCHDGFEETEDLLCSSFAKRQQMHLLWLVMLMTLRMVQTR